MTDAGQSDAQPGADANLQPFKAQAAHFTALFEEAGRSLGRGHALEAVAALHGLDCWRTLRVRPDAMPLAPEAALRTVQRRLQALGIQASDELVAGCIAASGLLPAEPTRRRPEHPGGAAHSSGLLVLPDTLGGLSPWPFLPLPDHVGLDVLATLRRARVLTWQEGGVLRADGEEMRGEDGQAVPEWVDVDGTRVEAWRTALLQAQALRESSNVGFDVGTAEGRLGYSVELRRGVAGVAEVPHVAVPTEPTVVLNGREDATALLALAYAAASQRPVYLVAHPVLVGWGRARKELAGPCILLPEGGTPLRNSVRLQADCLEGLREQGSSAWATLALYVDGEETRAAAVFAAKRGMQILALTTQLEEAPLRAALASQTRQREGGAEVFLFSKEILLRGAFERNDSRPVVVDTSEEISGGNERHPAARGNGEGATLSPLPGEETTFQASPGADDERTTRLEEDTPPYWPPARGGIFTTEGQVELDLEFYGGHASQISPAEADSDD